MPATRLRTAPAEITLISVASAGAANSVAAIESIKAKMRVMAISPILIDGEAAWLAIRDFRGGKCKGARARHKVARTRGGWLNEPVLGGDAGQAWPASVESIPRSMPIFLRAFSYLPSVSWPKISSESAAQCSQPFWL